MGARRGSLDSHLRPTARVALAVVFVVTVMVVLAPGTAQAAGHWTGGVLTSNGVDDSNPRLSPTHLVWAQRTASGWSVRLRELSSGTTKTIVDLPTGTPDVVPDLGMAGDYVTAFSRGDDRWYLYQLSTATLTESTATEVTIASVAGTDGTYVILVFDDGDGDIVSYNIAAHSWTKVTNDDVKDSTVRLDRGRILWETSSFGGGDTYQRSVIFRDLRSGIQQTIVTEWDDAAFSLGMSPRISRDWLGYCDPRTDKIRLQRPTDGLTVQTDGYPSPGWALTDDYAFWTERGLGDQVDLYAFDLRTLEKTRLTFDVARETLLAAESGRLLYAKVVDEAGPRDLMVVDLDASPVQPYRLVQGVSGPVGGWGVDVNASMSGDLIVVALDDGTDNEIAWARWVEDDVPTDFTDVPVGHPYAEAIHGLFAKGIISGYNPTTFGPDDPVMRQQFAKMITLTMGLPVVEGDFPAADAPFTDLGSDDPADLYPHEYIAVCARNEITLGKTATTFDPFSQITRAQVISMVVRAADELAPGTLATPSASWAGVLDYSDPTHGANIRRAEFNGLLAGIQGPGGALAGWDTTGDATRGEVAQMLWRLLAGLG